MNLKTRPTTVLANKLLARGVRMTNQRRLILELIERDGGHLDAARIQDLAKARETHVDRATVYRTLSLLKKHNLVEELDFLHVRGEQHFYELRERDNHLHACCIVCGKIMELTTDTLDSLKTELKEKLGFTSESVRVEVGGYCGKCKPAD